MTLWSLVDHLDTCGDAWFPWLVQMGISGSAVLTATWVWASLPRRRSAALRHLVWSLGSASVLILPLFSAVLPGWNLLPHLGETQFSLVGPTAAWMSAALSPEAPGREGLPPNATATDMEDPGATRGDPVSHSQPEALVSSGLRFPWRGWLLLVWLSIAALLLIPLGLGHLSLWWLERRSARMEQSCWSAMSDQLAQQLGLRRPVELLVSQRRTMPMIWGLWRTRLLLPLEALGWPADRARAVLLHELAHAQRWDCLTQTIAQMACALHWFNPLVWIAWRKIQTEREQACDDLVLSTGTKPSAYAEQLLHIALKMPAVRFRAAAIAIASSSRLEGRLLAILDASRNRKAVTRLSVLLASTAFLGFMLPVAMLGASACRPVTTEPASAASATSTRPVNGRISQLKAAISGNAATRAAGQPSSDEPDSDATTEGTRRTASPRVGLKRPWRDELNFVGGYPPAPAPPPPARSLGR